MVLIKSVGLLTLGQGTSQLINLAGYALLARTYAPDQFGIFAIFIGLVSVVSIVASGRYEMTILLPRCDIHASLAASVAMTLSLVLHSLTLVVVSLLVTYEVIKDFWLLLPIVSLFSSIINIGSFVQNRTKKYAEMAWVLVLRSVLFLMLAYFLGLGGGSGHNLIWAYCSAVSIVGCVVFALNRQFFFGANWRYKKCLVWIRKHIDFLKFSSPAVLVNTLSAQAPIFLLSVFFGVQSAGLYSMIQRVLLAPVGLIASAVNRVYMQRVAELKYSKTEIWPFTMSLIKYMVLAGLMLIPFAYIVFDLGLLALVFGDKWSALDGYAAMMLPLVFFALISSAVAGFAVLGKNRLGLIYQLFLLIVISSTVVLSKVLSGAVRDVYMAISLALSFVYICQIMSILLATKSVDKGNGYV